MQSTSVCFLCSVVTIEGYDNERLLKDLEKRRGAVTEVMCDGASQAPGVALTSTAGPSPDHIICDLTPWHFPGAPASKDAPQAGTRRENEKSPVVCQIARGS